MAPRKKKQRRRTNPNRINVLGLAEAYAQMAVLSRGALGVSPWEAIVGKAGTGYNPMTSDNRFLAYGANAVSLPELFKGWSTPHGGSSGVSGLTESQIVWENIKSNAVTMGIQSIGIGVGFRVGKRLLRKPLSMVRKGIKMAGLASVVTV